MPSAPLRNTAAGTFTRPCGLRWATVQARLGTLLGPALAFEEPSHPSGHALELGKLRVRLILSWGNSESVRGGVGFLPRRAEVHNTDGAIRVPWGGFVFPKATPRNLWCEACRWGCRGRCVSARHPPSLLLRSAAHRTTRREHVRNGSALLHATK